MKLYVANGTAQYQDFLYRMPEQPMPRMQRIGIGEQIQISGDLSRLEIDNIVNQHTRYGLVEEVEVDRTKPFVGMCYSIDKPVKLDSISQMVGHNREVLEDRGRVIRQESAIATSSVLETETPGLQALEMSVTEVMKDGSTPSISEGTRVTRRESANEAPPANKPRRRG